MARILLVSQSAGKFFATEPSYDKLVAALKAASHTVATTTFSAGYEAEYDVVVAWTDDADLSDLKRLARDYVPVIAVTRRDRTARRAVDNGAIWSVPAQPHLDVSLTQGMCSVDRAIAAKPYIDTDPRLKQFMVGRMHPAGVEKAAFDAMTSGSLLKPQVREPKLNRRQRRRREALGMQPAQPAPVKADN